MAIINFDYGAAIRQAKEIENVASEMKTLANRALKDVIDTIRADWTGEAATRFLTYCEATKSQILTKSDSLYKTASTIRSVAARLKEAEERAKTELARSSAGGGAR